VRFLQELSEVSLASHTLQCNANDFMDIDSAIASALGGDRRLTITPALRTPNRIFLDRVGSSGTNKSRPVKFLKRLYSQQLKRFNLQLREQDYECGYAFMNSGSLNDASFAQAVQRSMSHMILIFDEIGGKLELLYSGNGGKTSTVGECMLAELWGGDGLERERCGEESCVQMDSTNVSMICLQQETTMKKEFGKKKSVGVLHRSIYQRIDKDVKITATGFNDLLKSEGGNASKLPPIDVAFFKKAIAHTIFVGLGRCLLDPRFVYFNAYLTKEAENIWISSFHDIMKFKNQVASTTMSSHLVKLSENAARLAQSTQTRLDSWVAIREGSNVWNICLDFLHPKFDNTFPWNVENFVRCITMQRSFTRIVDSCNVYAELFESISSVGSLASNLSPVANLLLVAGPCLFLKTLQESRRSSPMAVSADIRKKLTMVLCETYKIGKVVEVKIGNMKTKAIYLEPPRNGSVSVRLERVLSTEGISVDQYMSSRKTSRCPDCWTLNASDLRKNGFYNTKFEKGKIVKKASVQKYRDAYKVAIDSLPKYEDVNCLDLEEPKKNVIEIAAMQLKTADMSKKIQKKMTERMDDKGKIMPISEEVWNANMARTELYDDEETLSARLQNIQDFPTIFTGLDEDTFGDRLIADGSNLHTKKIEYLGVGMKRPIEWVNPFVARVGRKRSRRHSHQKRQSIAISEEEADS